MPDKLEPYRRKRDFAATPEPAGDAAEAPAGARFVIQEHHATRLHWDLRFERDGALVSFAVPNGLPEEPKDNRLAVHTEDHPLEYLDFQGDIPKGSYGAGSMRVWDRGTYEELKWQPRKIEVALHGERVQGRYALFPIDKGEDPKNWMIHRMDPPADATREPMPDKIVPMMARLGPLPRDDERWAFEIKWDGVRAIAHSEPGRLHFHSRNLHDITPRYPELARLNRALSHHRAILDGEVVALDAEGRPNFGALQRRMHLTAESAVRRLSREAPVTYMIFDLLWLDGHSLMELPYRERRARLAELELTGDRWRTPDYVEGQGAAVLAATEQQGLEGVVAKRLDSPYEPGRRSPSWVKVKNVDRQEVVIGGWLPGEGRRRDRIGALAVGVREDGHLRYAGRVGTGFTEAELDRLATLLGPLERDTPPFDAPGQTAPPREAVWVEPEVVAEVEFREWTQGGQMRAPSYKGLRDDKAPEEVVREPRRRSGDGLEIREEKDKAYAIVDGREIKVSNLDKVLYPKVGFRKRDVIAFYDDIAPFVLPHLEGRPLTLKRYPNGVDAPYFYEKQAPSHRPEWVHTAGVPTGSKTIEFVVCDDRATLVWLANLADLELHTSLARGRGHPPPDGARVRPRSRRARDDRRVLPRRAPARGHVPRPRAAELPQDVGLEGPAGVRPAELARRPTTSRRASRRRSPSCSSARSRSSSCRARPRRCAGARCSSTGARTTSTRRRSTSTRCVRASGRPCRRRSRGTRSATGAAGGDPERLVFDADAVRARVEEHGDLFGPVVSLVQRLPAV